MKIFFKKERNVDFKPVESSLETAGLQMRLWPSKMHAYKTTSFVERGIQAPILKEREWKGKKKNEVVIQSRA